MSVTSDAAATAITNAIEAMAPADVQVLLKVMKAWMAQEEPYWGIGAGVYLPIAVTRTYAPPVGAIVADKQIVTESATRHWIARYNAGHTSFAVVAGNIIEVQHQNASQEFWGTTESACRMLLVDHVVMQNSTSWVLSGKIKQTNANNASWTRPCFGFVGRSSRSNAAAHDWVAVTAGHAGAGVYWVYGARDHNGTSDKFGGGAAVEVVDATYCTTGTEFELTGGPDGYYTYRYKKIGAGAWTVPAVPYYLSEEGFVPFGIFASFAHAANATTTTTMQIYDLALTVT